MSFPLFIKKVFNPLTTNVPYHIKASQLICNANQLTRSLMGDESVTSCKILHEYLKSKRTVTGIHRLTHFLEIQ